MHQKKTLGGIWEVLKDSCKAFSNDKVPKLSASLAYFTVFSFPPLLIVIIYVCSIFYGRNAVEGTVYEQLKGFVGADTAVQLENLIKSAAVSSNGTLALIIGIVVLIIGATSIFGEVQDSINMIWCLKAKPHLGWKPFIKNRLISFGMIGSLGFLLLVSLTVSTLVDALGHQLGHYLPHLTVTIIYFINLFIFFCVAALLFAVIFKALPDANVKWKDVWPGSIATALLFLAGRGLISFYITKTKVGSTYGGAGTIVVLLVWIYLSALILYFGAEFTKAWAIKYRQGITASSYAVVIDKTIVEKRTDKLK